MTEAAIIGLRWFQYVGAVTLLGAPLFLLTSFRRNEGSVPAGFGRILLVAAGTVSLASAVALVAQTAMMAGSWSEALKPASLSFVVTGTALGAALLIRALIAALAVSVVCLLPPGRVVWRLLVGLGLIVAASFAWTGHGASTEGPGHGLHLASDILHAVAASIWVGALAAFAALVVYRPREPSMQDRALARALAGFASVGTFAVAVLVLTGLVNSVFLVRWSGFWTLTDTAYGRWLLLKLVLFGLMLSLAAVNRFRLTPAFETAGADSGPAIGHLRRSLVVEFALSLAVLTIVAVMGTLAPPASLL